jgi:hypothetical protein
MTIFPSFRSTVTPFVPRNWPANLKLLVDPVTGAPAGIESPNANGPHGIWTPVDLTAGQIASPSTAMIADLNATYRLNVAPYTRYQSDGTTLQAVTAGGVFLPLAGGAVTGATTFGATVGVTGLTSANGGIKVGTGTLTGLAYTFQTAINADPSLLLPLNRQTMFQTTLTYSTTGTNIWEGLTSFVNVAAAAGTAQGEINVMHAYANIALGATITAIENHESSLENFGSITGTAASYLAIMSNKSTGTASGSMFGMKAQLNQDNVTVGAVAQYYAIDNEPMSGAGSVPTIYGFIRNADPSGHIVSLGRMSLGTLTPPGAGELLHVIGSDNSGGTFPVQVISANANKTLLCANDNTVFFANLAAKIDGSGNFTGVSYKVSTNQVVGARATGWTAMTGTPDASTAFATSTVTLAQLAGRVMSLQAALTTHGLIGA